MGILEVKDTITKIKSSPDGLTSMPQITEERGSTFDDKSIEIIQSEQQRKKIWSGQEEQSPFLPWENIQMSDVCVIRVPERVLEGGNFRKNI